MDAKSVNDESGTKTGKRRFSVINKLAHLYIIVLPNLIHHDLESANSAREVLR